jgi:hypothetical protein
MAWLDSSEVVPSGPYTLIKDHLAGGASRLAALLLLQILRYSQSSRLAIRAPRSAIWSLFTVYGPLDTRKFRRIFDEPGAPGEHPFR